MMNLHKPIWLTLFLSLISVAATSAQPLKGVVACQVQIATNCTGSTGMRACSLRRNTGGGTAPSCVVAMSNNANCTIALAGTYMQTFNAVQTGADPSCQWSCSACDDVMLDTTDGLPVELLEFEIAAEDPEDEADQPD